MAKVLEGPGMGLMKKWGIVVPHYAVVSSVEELTKLSDAETWLRDSKLVAKAHEALGSRLKLGLVKINLDLTGAKAAIRPANLFYQTGGQGPLMLGECFSMPPGFAQPVLYETIEHAIARSPMHSADMFTCLADQSASSCTTAIANTPCAAPSPGRSRPLVHSEWPPVVISETTMGARLIYGPATCDICANKG